MEQLEVRIVTLEPMLVASAYGFGSNPEEQAWGKILTWTRALNLLEGEKEPRFFGFNNPDPSPGSPNYVYEQWMTVDSEVETGDDVTLKKIEGGLYAVSRCLSLTTIGQDWKNLARWCEESKYEMGNHQWLEESLSPLGTKLEDLIFDLYFPIATL